MIVVKSKIVQLHAFSLPGHNLPTFSKATLKTVYWKWGWFSWKLRRYVVFTEIEVTDNLACYYTNYTRVK